MRGHTHTHLSIQLIKLTLDYELADCVAHVFGFVLSLAQLGLVQEN